MKYASIFLILLLGTTMLFAESKTPEWENPEIFAINKEAPHATIVPFQSKDAALTADAQKSDRYLSLNGEWKFKFLDKPADAPKDFWHQNSGHGELPY